MALKDTCKNMKDYLECIQQDLEKAEAGNKAAAQRVRTCSIKFEKAAKMFRKESIKAERGGGGSKKSSKKSAPARGKSHAPAHKPAASKPAAVKHKKKSSPAKKKKSVSKAMARKKPTAKLLKKSR